MTDRELLEQAAKAGGIRLEWDGHPDQWAPMYYEGKTYHSWNPFEDDGDALRLAVKLGLLVHVDKDTQLIRIIDSEAFRDPVQQEPFGTDACAATRRAIVRAAAARGGE